MPVTAPWQVAQTTFKPTFFVDIGDNDDVD
jgi:hypothetical protein